MGKIVKVLLVKVGLLFAVTFSVKILPNFDAHARSHQYFITRHENSCDFEGLIFLLQDRSLLCPMLYWFSALETCCFLSQVQLWSQGYDIYCSVHSSMKYEGQSEHKHVSLRHSGNIGPVNLNWKTLNPSESPQIGKWEIVSFYWPDLEWLSSVREMLDFLNFFHFPLLFVLLVLLSLLLEKV